MKENIREAQNKLKAKRAKKYSKVSTVINWIVALIILGVIFYFASVNGCNSVGDIELVRLEDGHQYFKSYGAENNTLEHAAGCDHDSHQN